MIGRRNGANLLLGVTIARKVFAFMAYELNAKMYTSRQFSVISPMFSSRSSFKPVHKLIPKLCARNTSK